MPKLTVGKKTTTRPPKPPAAQAPAPTRRVVTPNISALHGFRAIQANICHDCSGPLLAADGTFSERTVIVSTTSAYAAAICNACRGKLNEAKRQFCNLHIMDEEIRLRCYLKAGHRGQHKYEEVEED